MGFAKKGAIALLCLVMVITREEFMASAVVEDDIISMLDEDSHTDLGSGDEVSSMEGAGLGMDDAAEFHSFTSTHQKQYKTHGEYQKRYSVWKDNLAFVHKWNSNSEKAFDVGMNEFADLTDEEFAASYLNQNLHDEYLASETFRAEESLIQESAGSFTKEESKANTKGSDADYDIRWHKNTFDQPESQDWTKVGAVSEVNNQAKCFACYAFAACGAIEGAIKLQTGVLTKLSAQQIVDCSTPTSGFNNHGCKGGTMVKSYKYIIKNGLMKWDDYGYRTEMNSRPECKLSYANCKFNKDQVYQRIQGYVNIRKGVEDDIKNAVGIRPVSAAIDAHHRPFKLYRSGVFSLESCTTHLTHGLLIVGYGEQDGRKYWKVKNSWGTTWGAEGFGMVLRDANMCAIGNWANYPIIPNDAHLESHTVMSLSELGDNPDA